MKKNYSNIRPGIKTGDIVGVHGKRFFSKIIQFFTGSIISHIAIFVWIGDRLFIVESIEGVGVRIEPFSEYIKKNKCFWMRVDTVFDEETIFKRIFWKTKGVPEIGSPYDMKGALLSMFYDTKSAFSFCSEYAKKVLMIDFPGMTAGITPKDITNKSIFMIEIL